MSEVYVLTEGQAKAIWMSGWQNARWWAEGEPKLVLPDQYIAQSQDAWQKVKTWNVFGGDPYDERGLSYREPNVGGIFEIVVLKDLEELGAKPSIPLDRLLGYLRNALRDKDNHAFVKPFLEASLELIQNKQGDKNDPA